MLEVKKFNPFFLVLKLDKFLFFDNSFSDLADFQNLDNFLPFKFLNLDNFWFFDNFLTFNNFPHFLINLLLFSMPPTLLVASTYNNTVVFIIDINSVTILLKL